MDINKRKFHVVKEELFDFLVVHRDYFNMLNMHTFLNDGTSGNMMVVYCSLSLEQFLPLDYFEKYYDTFVKHINCTKEFQIDVCIQVEKDEIINKVKHVLNKQNITNCDLKMSFENHYLVSESNCKSKFLRYKEVYAFIGKIISNYLNKKVSTKRIDRMSFKFQGSIKNNEDQKSCGICMGDYKKKRLVCQLPCNHFYHTSCLKKWFTKSVHCPFCRDDCT